MTTASQRDPLALPAYSLAALLYTVRRCHADNPEPHLPTTHDRSRPQLSTLGVDLRCAITCLAAGPGVQSRLGTGAVALLPPPPPIDSWNPSPQLSAVGSERDHAEGGRNKIGRCPTCRWVPLVHTYRSQSFIPSPPHHRRLSVAHEPICIPPHVQYHPF